MKTDWQKHKILQNCQSFCRLHSDITEKALFIVKPVAETNLGNAGFFFKKTFHIYTDVGHNLSEN